MSSINLSHKKRLIGGLILLGLIQLAVPGYMIAHQEDIRNNGNEYKFRAVPVDPYDMFRGRYINLTFDDARLKRDGRGFKRGEAVYAILTIGPDGFAHLADVSRTPPSQGDYFPVKVSSGWEHELMLELPFNRYYLKENHAPEAENFYFMSVNRKNAWVTVKIKNGETALTELYINGRPIGQAWK